MILNISIAALLMVLTIVIHASGMMLALKLFQKESMKLRQRLHLFRALRIGIIVVIMFLVSVIEVLVWAITYLKLNALEEPLPDDYDIIYTSLFLHHLSEDEARLFLSKQAKAAQCAVLVNDLRRSTWGFVMATVGCHLLSRSPIVHFDGPQSVKAAFRTEEILRLAQESGLKDSRITTHWPQRYLLHWDKPQGGPE